MYTILLTIHIIVAVLVVLIVLIQSGRSGGLSGLMGGGGGDALFSTSGQQSGLRRATVIMAVIFMATSLGLTFLTSRSRNVTVFQKRFPDLPPVQSNAAPQAETGSDAEAPLAPSGLLENTGQPSSKSPVKPDPKSN